MRWADDADGERLTVDVLAEISTAWAAYAEDRPQRCGHSSDPMCCPYENFPALAEWFTNTPA